MREVPAAVREFWSDRISDPNGPGRYLYAAGDARFVAASFVLSAAVADFLKRLAARTSEQALLVRLHFLLRPAMRRFVDQDLPELVRSLSHTSSGNEALTRRGIRGKMLWAQTARARLSGRADRATFVVRELERSTDLPENELLKLFLTQVHDAIVAISKLIGTGNLIAELEELGLRVTAALRDPRLRDLRPAMSATSLMRQRALRSRNLRYSRLSVLQEELEQTLVMGRWESILRLLQSGWIEPIKSHDLFELFCLVETLSELRDRCGFGEPKTYGLVRTGRGAIANFERTHQDFRETLDVYFDQSPASSVVFGSASEYIRVLALYEGISGNLHRPDLVLRYRKWNQAGIPSERRLFIEAKETADDEYLRESVYKGFGYLRDFFDTWVLSPDQHPKIVVAVPRRIALAASADEARSELVLVTVDAASSRLGDVFLRAFNLMGHPRASPEMVP